MAREYIPYPPEIAKNRWLTQEAKCPICRHLVKSWYCPNCGLPINNSSFYMLHTTSYHCGANHFRSGFGEIVNFQLCSKCYTPNPFDANYCRSCGENITTQARDKDGHGWVDLGLSVLWSSENMEGFYCWMDTEDRTYIGRPSHDSYNKTPMKDTATEKWGTKWRMPTKEEFEELIEKCNWKPVIISETKQPALKVTGPNGNFIIIPTTGQLGAEDRYGRYPSLEDKLTLCSLWTSTAYDISRNNILDKAYCFRYIIHTDSYNNKWLTDEEKKSLWLSTTIKHKGFYTLHHNGEEKEVSMISPRGYCGVPMQIRPVADKKWKGKL